MTTGHMFMIVPADKRTGEPMFGVHPSAEAARLRYNPVMPMDLVWEEEEEDLSEPNPPDGPDEEAAPALLRLG